MEDGAEAKLAREPPVSGHSLHQEDRLHKQHQNLQERYRHVNQNNSVSGPPIIYTAKME